MDFHNYEKIFKKRSLNSRRLYVRAAKVFPGGVSHNIRFFKPYPFFVNKSQGKTLYDVDKNKYTDYWMGHWALILGHSPKPVMRALSKQATSGTLYGTANDVSVELGELIQKIVPKAELLRFSSTGSEATMYAVRLARAKSNKRVIVKIIGGWHGYNTTLLQAVNHPFEFDEGPGLLQDEEQFVESIPFNDLERATRILESVKDDLAGIIVEPVLGGAGCIPAERTYLHGIQEFAKRNDSIFILDEIVTGFRLSINGASSFYKLDPDLFTLGKIVGGGMPIGVLCGKKEVMSLADPILRDSKETCCAVGGGTFSANPMTMVAGLNTLTYLERNEANIFPKINKLGGLARQGLSKVFRDAKIPAEVTGIGSIFLTHFLNDNVKKISSADDVARSSKEVLRRYHFALMAKHRIFFLPLKMGAISSAHTQNDIKLLLHATNDIASSGILLEHN